MKINHDLAQATNQLFKNLSGIKNIETSSTKNSTQLAEIDLSQFSSVAKSGVKLAMDMGVSLTESDAVAIGEFMESAPGSLEEKLMAISTMIDKHLPMDVQVMGDVHVARSVSLVDFLQMPHSNQTKTHKESETLKTAPSLKLATSSVDTLIAALFESIKEESATNNQHSTGSQNEKKLTTDTFKSDDEADIDEALIMQLADIIRSVDNESIKEIENNKVEVLQKQVPIVNGLSEGKLAKSAQMFLKETVTPKLMQVKKNFETFKGESANLLRQITGTEKPMTADQKVLALSKLIDKLDQAIMKSEIGLYIDMKSEKVLLRQSSQLSDAREHLIKGQLSKSEKIVQDVLKVIEDMTFKPTIKKAIAVGNPDVFSGGDHHYNDIVKWAKGSIAHFSESEKSVSVLTHYLRRLGVNHEAEVFQKVFGKTQANQHTPQKSLQNLKTLLLQMTKDTNGKVETEQAQKVLSHINGQQIHLKVNDKAQPQQLMLSIPMSLQGHLTDVKVFIKSQQQDLKVDWQNFNMFFVLDTKRFGDVGIKVSSIDKKVRIDIHNNRAESEAIIKPLATMLKFHVEEIGFSVTGVHFSPWGKEHPNRHVAPEKRDSVDVKTYAQASSRGFDFTI